MKITKSESSVELVSGNGTKMVIATDWGPRISSFKSPGGVEFMFSDPERKIRRGPWAIGGGGRVWTWRDVLADEVEESYSPDNEPCTVKALDLDHKKLLIMGAACPAYCIQRGFHIEETRDHYFFVTSIVKNVSDGMLWSGGIWAIAAIDPLCFISVPTGDPASSWQDTALHIVEKWAGHQTTATFLEQLRLRPGMINILAGEFGEGKVMLGTPAGAIAATKGNAAFFKISSRSRRLDPADRYPAGCNLAVYANPDGVFREVEHMGPKCSRLEPGKELLHSEMWAALDNQPMSWWDDPGILHALVKQLSS